MEVGRLETGDWRLETGDWRLETGDWRLEAGDWRLETGDWRLETGGVSLVPRLCLGTHCLCGSAASSLRSSA